MRPCWQAAGLGFCGQRGAALDPAHWLAHEAAQLGAGRSAFFPSHAAPAQAGEGFWPARTPAENPAARPTRRTPKQRANPPVAAQAPCRGALHRKLGAGETGSRTPCQSCLASGYVTAEPI